jgi:hypothetical protein
MNKRLDLLTALAIAAGIVLASGAPAAAQGGCQVVHQLNANLSDDGGLSFLPYRGTPMPDSSLTWGLAATGVPGLIYMQSADTVWVSEDDGCNWTSFGATASDLFRIAPGSGAIAYAWPDNGGKFLYRLEPNGGGNVDYVSSSHPAPEPTLLGFGVDANDSLHVRAVGRTGQIWESFQGGAAKTWVAIGEPANPEVGLSYFATFDPNDLDHVVFGQALDGGFVTFDGGQSWDRSLYIPGGPGSSVPPGQASDRVNSFTAVISPVDGNTVYARAIDLEESEAGDPSRGRHVYLSTDGGVSFVPVIDDVGDGAWLPNQPLMVADRYDADILNLVLSQSPIFGGTYFYRYDHSTDTVQTTNNRNIPVVRSITFSLANPERMIVGFQIVGQ